MKRNCCNLFHTNEWFIKKSKIILKNCYNLFDTEEWSTSITSASVSPLLSSCTQVRLVRPDHHNYDYDYVDDYDDDDDDDNDDSYGSTSRKYYGLG